MEAGRRHRGRRPASSRATLIDAADELFLENGYAATTIEQITRRAGVSRNTFFNYFEAKSDLLFAGVDDVLARLSARLGSAGGGSPLELVRLAVLETARGVDPLRIPLAATQAAAMGVEPSMQASGMARFAALAEALHRFLGERRAFGATRIAGDGALQAQAAGYALAGACVAAGMRWLAAGVGRGALTAYVEAAIDPVVRGFGAQGGAGLPAASR